MTRLDCLGIKYARDKERGRVRREREREREREEWSLQKGEGLLVARFDAC